MVPRPATSAEQATLQRAHGDFVSGLRVVRAAEVQGAVGHEQQKLVGGRPADISRLATATIAGLLDRSLHRDRDVPDVCPAARPRFGRRARRWKRCWLEHRKGEHVGRAVDAHVLGVEVAELSVIGEYHSDRRRERSTSCFERAPDRACDHRS